MTASHEGTDEIGMAVAATTFSIVAVFVPVAFMYGVAGQWFKPFALTIASSVLVSLSCLSPSTRCCLRTGRIRRSRHTSAATRSRARSRTSISGSTGWLSDTRV